MIVTATESGSPVEKAGVKIGDKILEIDGQAFDHEIELTSYAVQKNKGEIISVKLEREGEALLKSIELESYRAALERGGFQLVGTQGTEAGRNLGHPATCGAYPPNAWGFTEMHGNVSEWCGDRYGIPSSAPATDPVGEAEGKFRIVKGGQWTGPEQGCRAGARGYLVPRVDAQGGGFRVALVPKGSLPWIQGQRSVKSRTRIVPNQYATIQAAIDDARNGDTILVNAGIYRETIVLHDWKDIEIRGENRNTTIVRAEDPTRNLLEAIRVDRGRISNLTFEFLETGGTKVEKEKRRSLLLLTSDSRTTVSGCIFRGGRNMFGAYCGVGESLITDCQMENCVAGLVASGIGSNSTLRDNTISRSEWSGILIEYGANCTAQGNVSKNNQQSGILALNESTTARLIRNTCTENDGNGIAFMKGSTGSAEGNECYENLATGIELRDTVGIELVDNVSSRNKQSGVFVVAGETTVIKSNRCEENDRVGIAVSQSSPLIENNHCNKNRFSGIAVQDGACKPRVISNTCNENGENGIAVAREAYPAEFRDNQASGNKKNPQINRTVKFRKLD